MNNESRPFLMERPDYLVCTCMGVMYTDIVQAIKNGHGDFDSLSALLMVGEGCTSCVAEIEQILEEESKN